MADAALPPRPSPEQLRQWFDAIDKDRNGRLTCMELQSALQLGGLNFSLATVNHVIRIHDRSNSGSICFEEVRCALLWFVWCSVDSHSLLPPNPITPNPIRPHPPPPPSPKTVYKGGLQ